MLHVKDGIKNFAKEISVLKIKPRAGRSQKIETDELQALLDINSQTEKELAEQLGVTQQTISARLHTMGKVRKEGRWVSA
ncbi:hypothetical protein P5V15_011715 [Pogonomyrmex californicus]